MQAPFCQKYAVFFEYIIYGKQIPYQKPTLYGYANLAFYAHAYYNIEVELAGVYIYGFHFIPAKGHYPAGMPIIQNQRCLHRNV